MRGSAWALTVFAAAFLLVGAIVTADPVMAGGAVLFSAASILAHWFRLLHDRDEAQRAADEAAAGRVFRDAPCIVSERYHREGRR